METSFIIDNQVVSFDNSSQILKIQSFKRFTGDINKVPHKTWGSRLDDNKILQQLANGEINFEFIKNKE